jgi:hypothetical protein
MQTPRSTELSHTHHYKLSMRPHNSATYVSYEEYIFLYLTPCSFYIIVTSEFLFIIWNPICVFHMVLTINSDCFPKEH